MNPKTKSFYFIKSACQINQIKTLILVIIIGIFKVEAQLLKIILLPSAIYKSIYQR